jgi:uncharacterized RDD family membrane protein YckC
MFLLLFVVAGLINAVTFKAGPVFFVLFILIIAYKPVTEWLFGATAGKAIFKIRVVDKKNKKISLADALIRFAPLAPFCLLTANALKCFVGRLHGSSIDDLMIFLRQFFNHPHIFVIFLYICASGLIVVDAIPVLFTKKQRAMHDMLSGTFCIFGPRRGAKGDPRSLFIFIVMCITVVYYFSLPNNQKSGYPPPVAQYFGDCVVRGFAVTDFKPVARIDAKWFNAGDYVCGGRIVKITQADIEVKFTAKTTVFKPGQVIADE